MTISSGRSPSFHYNRENYLRDFDELKKATSSDTILIDKKGHFHCVGTLQQMARQAHDIVAPWLGESVVVRRELDPEFLKGFLKLGSAQGWLESNEINEMAAKFKDYKGAATDAKANVTFNKTIRPDKVDEKDTGSETASVTSSSEMPPRVENPQDVYVRPSQIMPQLKKHLLKSIIEPSELKVYAYALCREINEVSMEGKLKPGESYKLEAGSQQYPIQLYGKVYKDDEGNWQAEKKDAKSIEFPFDCWVKLSEDGKKVSILFRENKKLAEGGYKTVKKGQNFEIRLEVGKKADGTSQSRKINYSPKIVFQDKGNPETILEGLETHKKLLETVAAAGAKIVELPKFPVARSAEDDGLEMEQKWYNGTLKGAAENGVVPLDIQEDTGVLAFTPEDSVSCIMDVTKTLKIIHSKDIVHRDVKWINILLNVAGKSKIEGLLADLDLIQEVGTGDSWDYIYWDKSSQEGWVLPLSDCYGMAMTIGESWVPGFVEILEDPEMLTAETLAKKKSESFNNVILTKLVGKDHELYDLLVGFTTKEDLLDRIDAALADEELTDEQGFVLENLKKETVLIDFIMANQNQTKKGMLTALDGLIKDPNNGLSGEQRKALKESKKEVVLADFALTTALKLINDSEKVHEFLVNNDKLRNELLTQPEDLTHLPKKKRDAAAKVIRHRAAVKIQSMTNYTTTAKMEEQLKFLKHELKTL